MPQQSGVNRLDSPEEQLRQLHSGARILLTEDNVINIEVMRELLHAANMDVVVARNGLEALEHVRASRFDLVLMDMQMPLMDGLEATRAIRNQPDMANLPILALTANAFAEDRRACMEAGMNDMLTKPVEPEVLYVTLLKWLDRP